MPAPTLCLECNAPLSASDTGGVCAKCLLKLGLASQLAAGSLPAIAQGLLPDGTIEEPFDFGGYRIIRLLGKGGMGAVYEAEQVDGGRRVALKVLGQSLDTPEMRQRFIREGQLAAAVRHENVVAVLAADEIEATPVISMELLHEGTLKDRVTKNGPLPPQEAVDAALQIIAGLDSAHHAGVLHRDVKPANCFCGSDGKVKVGDFGLSISTLAKAEHSLTQSGTVLGTPSFAAPEQLRGEDVDARADIYAVGATLYYLLTGRPAFEEENLVSLIAAVLQKEPVDVSARREELPRGLSAVVMRCLAKDRNKRFRDYGALRAALQPYASTASTPATVGLRFAAGIFDSIGSLIPSMIGLAIWSDAPETHWISDPTIETLSWALASLVWIVLWYAIPEGIWGRSFGKALCHLRVIRENGSPINLPVALVRSLIFNINSLLTPLVTALVYSAQRYDQAMEAGEWLPTDWLWLLLFLPLFITMRRKNGYATVYDLITKSRVVEDRAVEDSRPTMQALVPPNSLPVQECIGPYALIERKGRIGEAFDPVLRRKLWIHFVEDGTPPITDRRRDVVRATRLRWLQGRRNPGEHWDAYEHPHGECILASLAGTEQWERGRVWLADVADELHAGTADKTLSPDLSLANVWITAAGHGVLLDFPAPGFEETPAYPVNTVEQVEDFLFKAAQTRITPLVPLHARSFLDGLSDRRFEAVPLVAGNLRALVHRPAKVNARRRVLSAFLMPFLFTVFFVLVGSIFLSPRHDFDKKWAREHSSASPRLALEVMSSLEESAWDLRPLLARHLARNYGSQVLGDAFWKSGEVEAMSAVDLVERSGVEYYVAADLAHVERSPVPDEKELRDRQDFSVLLSRQSVRQSVPYWIVSCTVIGTAVALGLGFICALLFRIVPMLRLFGLAVVRKDGALAGRARLAARALLAGVPIYLAAAFVMKPLERWFWEPHMDFPAAWIPPLLVVSIIWLAGFLVNRGPAERLTGTYIVPR